LTIDFKLGDGEIIESIYDGKHKILNLKDGNKIINKIFHRL